MRYRLEMLDDGEFIIRNVETDLVLGSVIPLCVYDPRHPHCHTVAGCTVLNKNGDEIATISASTVPVPLEKAAIAVASHEAYYGYPGFKGGAQRPDSHRVEWLLGTLLADTVSVIARALIEYRGAGLKAATKSKYAELIAQLYAIWSASRFGSWDAERGVYDPYFANTPTWEPRMSFGAAAQHYGKSELRDRFPDANETELHEALSWPLELLTCTLKHLMRP